MRKSISAAALFRNYIILQMFLFLFAICDFFTIWCACAALIIEGGVLSGIYGLDSICRFYYIFGQLLQLWTCRMKIYTMLLVPWPYLSNCYSPTDVLTKITSLTKHHALIITHLHPHPPQLHKLAKRAIAVNANLVHFLSHSNHSDITHTDTQLIPLEKIRSSRDSVRKARESHLIDKAMTLEPHGLNRRDELL